MTSLQVQLQKKQTSGAFPWLAKKIDEEKFEEEQSRRSRKNSTGSLKTETESEDSISGDITSDKEREQELRAEDGMGSGDEEIKEKPEV